MKFGAAFSSPIITSEVRGDFNLINIIIVKAHRGRPVNIALAYLLYCLLVYQVVCVLYP